MYKYELANAAGVSYNTFRRWLSGKRSKLAELGASPRGQPTLELTLNSQLLTLNYYLLSFIYFLQSH